jgi:hypothetical protein
MAPERIAFTKELMRYKRVDCGGKIMNNTGGRILDKTEFLKNYKFTIAFENASYPGYTTEKIMEALLAGTIPIYWGNPLVHRDFNPECFIDCHQFESFDAVIAHVIEVDNDSDLFNKYVTAPIFENGVDNEFVNEENIKRQFDKIFAGPVKSTVAHAHDRVKYWLHPARPWYTARSLYRQWRTALR